MTAWKSWRTLWGPFIYNSILIICETNDQVDLQTSHVNRYKNSNVVCTINVGWKCIAVFGVYHCSETWCGHSKRTLAGRQRKLNLARLKRGIRERLFLSQQSWIMDSVQVFDVASWTNRKLIEIFFILTMTTGDQCIRIRPLSRSSPEEDDRFCRTVKKAHRTVNCHY